jgi:hypothetical protein
MGENFDCTECASFSELNERELKKHNPIDLSKKCTRCAMDTNNKDKGKGYRMVGRL